MADGKQWYNSPDKGPDKKKAGAKPVSPSNKTGKPVAKSSAQAAGRTGKKMVKGQNKNPQRVVQGQKKIVPDKNAVKPETKPAEKSIIPL